MTCVHCVLNIGRRNQKLKCMFCTFCGFESKTHMVPQVMYILLFTSPVPGFLLGNWTPACIQATWPKTQIIETWHNSNSFVREQLFGGRCHSFKLHFWKDLQHWIVPLEEEKWDKSDRFSPPAAFKLRFALHITDSCKDHTHTAAEVFLASAEIVICWCKVL